MWTPGVSERAFAQQTGCSPRLFAIASEMSDVDERNNEVPAAALEALIKHALRVGDSDELCWPTYARGGHCTRPISDKRPPRGSHLSVLCTLVCCTNPYHVRAHELGDL